MPQGKPCRRCLLNELDKNGYFEDIYKYIDSLPAEIKATPEEYAARLAICKGCERLINGMCAECGCFAEVRAAKKAMSCPSAKKLW